MQIPINLNLSNNKGCETKSKGLAKSNKTTSTMKPTSAVRESGVWYGISIPYRKSTKVGHQQYVPVENQTDYLSLNNPFESMYACAAISFQSLTPTGSQACWPVVAR